MPPPDLRFAPEALAQLVRIRNDERFAGDARREMIARIVAACQDRAENPLRYPKGEREGTRRRRIEPFIVVYRLTEGGVEIVNVWHEKQNRLG